MKVSIKDIANKAGVSTALVSLALNGKEKEGRISKPTAEKIKAIATELNYSPNRFAKGLKKGKSNILGFIVADISNPFYAKLLRYIEDEAENYGYKIIIGSSDENAKKMASLIDVMKSYHVDGFIIVPPENSQNQLQQLLHEGNSVVLVDRYFREIYVDNVLINNSETSQKATEYLIKQGCRNLGAFTYKSDLLHFRDRINGFKEALKLSKLPFGKESINYIRFENMYEDTKLAIDNLIHHKKKYDGFVFFTDTLALNGIKALMQLQINISEKIKIVSFDENETFNFLNFTVPHFTQPLPEIGKETIELIVAQIESKVKPDPKKIIFSAKWFEQ